MQTFDSIPNEHRVRESEELGGKHSTSKCPTVLLKADTGTDVNLMNSRTFDTLFNAKIGQYSNQAH